MANYDEKILKMQAEIARKREEIQKLKKFIPVTNCILILDGESYNLHVLQREELAMLLLKVNLYKMSADNLGMKIEIGKYPIEDWLTDIESKLNICSLQKKEKELEDAEKSLSKMLSSDKKTELRLAEIENLLK